MLLSFSGRQLGETGKPGERKLFFDANIVLMHLIVNGINVLFFQQREKKESEKKQKLFSLKHFPGFFNMGGCILTLQLCCFRIHLNLQSLRSLSPIKTWA